MSKDASLNEESKYFSKNKNRGKHRNLVRLSSKLIPDGTCKVSVFMSVAICFQIHVFEYFHKCLAT